jgi:hypothetical protein
MNIVLLSEYGIDYAKGMARCSGDETLYGTLLRMFLNDKSFLNAKSAFQSKNYPALFSSLHELKGLSGNLSFTLLHESTKEIVEILRNGEPSYDLITPMFFTIERDYERVIEGIQYTFKE